MAFMNDEFERACHGIADLHEYNNFKPSDIAKGYFKGSGSGNVYKSNSPLNSRALYQIAEEAKRANYFEGYVNWLKVAISTAKKENQTSGYMKTLRSENLFQILSEFLSKDKFFRIALKNAKLLHDEMMEKMLEDITSMKSKHGIIQRRPTFNEEPYFKKKELKSLLDEYDEHCQYYNSDTENLVPPGYSWKAHDLSFRLGHFMRRKKQKLCNGIVGSLKTLLL